MLKENHMISSRRIEESDRVRIEQALARDTFHPDAKSDIFYQEGVITNAYEDEAGIALFVRAYKVLHIDLLCFDNGDHVRNRAALEAGWPALVAGARAGGFKEIVTSVNGPALLKFVTKKIEDGGFGFEKIEVNGEIALRRML
jgi:hypothetical protein